MIDLKLRETFTATASEDFKKNRMIGARYIDKTPLLADSGFPDHFDEVKEWYDGYRFGGTTIYNPWSVIKHIEDLTVDSKSCPMLYWKGTSGNAIIR